MDYKVKGTDLTSVADAIRTKAGISGGLSFPDGFVSEIGNIPSGGSANVVTGTFKGLSTDKGNGITVSIPYTGNGYPLYGLIFPSGGSFKSGSAIASLSQNSAIFFWAFSKNDFSSEPDYSENAEENKAEIIVLYRYGESVSSGMGHQVRLYQNSNPGATSGNCVKLKDNKTMGVFIASTSYGFPDDIEFTYQIVYSE